MSVSVPQAQMFFLALTRVLALLIQVPVLAGRATPDQVKIALGILVTIVIIPWQPLPADAPTLDLINFAAAIFREVLIGTLAGFAASLIFGALQIAGTMMGVGSGFAAGQILNPTLGDTGSAMDQVFVILATLLFLVMDGHHVFLMGVQRTFIAVPLGQPLPALDMARLVNMSSELITAGVQMSLSVMGTLLLTDITLGLLARVAPQIQVFFLGMPVKIGVGFLALGLSLTALFPYISDLFRSLLPRMLHLIGV